MKQLLLLTDSGHGGLVKKGDNLVYTTGLKKRYVHADGSEALEGVINRKAESNLVKQWDSEGRAWVDVSSGNLDIPLRTRVKLANNLNVDYRDKYNLVYLSMHSNAGKGTGIEVFTSKGQTRSDELAEICIQELNTEFPDIAMRKDASDGDSDKEEDFYVLRNTRMPAILVEFLFFDNADDWKLLQSDSMLWRYSYALYKSLRIIEEAWK